MKATNNNALSENTKRKSVRKTNTNQRCGEILRALRGNPEGLSRRQIAELLGVGVHCVTASVLRLLNQGAIHEAGTIFDQETQRNVTLLRSSDSL